MLPAGQLAERLSIVKVQSYSARGAGVGVGGVSSPAGRVWGPPQENLSFENALRVSFRLSGVHI